MLSHFQEKENTKIRVRKTNYKKYTKRIDVYIKKREYYQYQLSTQVDLIAGVKNLSEELLSVGKNSD